MGIVYKVLGQSNPAINTVTTLYTVPGATSAVVSTVAICNQSSTSANFDLAVRPAGATLESKHYISYRTTLAGYQTTTLTLGITLAATDVISCNANTNTVSFNIFGSEIS